MSVTGSQYGPGCATLPLVPVPAEPHGSSTDGAGSAVGPTARALQLGPRATPGCVAMGAPVGVLPRSVADAERAASRSPGGLGFGGGRLSGDAQASRPGL